MRKELGPRLSTQLVLRAPRPCLAARRSYRAPSVRGRRPVAADAARAVRQLTVRRRGGDGAPLDEVEAAVADADRGNAAAASRLGLVGAGDGRRRGAPSLGCVAAPRARDARGSCARPANGCPALRRLRSDRPGSRPSCQRRGDLCRTTASCYARSAREAARSAPDLAEAERSPSSSSRASSCRMSSATGPRRSVSWSSARSRRSVTWR